MVSLKASHPINELMNDEIDWIFGLDLLYSHSI